MRTFKKLIFHLILLFISFWLIFSLSCNINPSSNSNNSKSDDTTIINTPPTVLNSDKWVVAYHPLYQWGYIPDDKFPWDNITHLILGYLWASETDTGNGYTLVMPDGTAITLNEWINMAKDYIEEGHQKGKIVNCMLGGEGSNLDLRWNHATENDALVTAFANNIKSILKDQAGFDGVDLDWEENIDYTGFINLTAKLREVWPEAIITIPTQPAGLDANDFAPAKDYIDAFMPMSYLSFIQWGGWILPMPLTPIYNYSTNHYSIDTTLERWTTAGVSASKIITGIGGFGCVWGDNNPYDGVGPNKPYCSTLNSNPEGEVQALASDNIVTQKWLNELLNNNPSKLIETWDDIGKCSYWHSSSINRVDMAVSNFLGSDHYISLVFYETPRSISEKVDYINKNNMKGMMFWTLSQMIDENNSFPIVEHIVFK